MVRALYPGSFDPITRGHLDLVERGQQLFESVTVAIAENVAKQPVFAVEERLALARAVLPAGVEAVAFRGLVVDFCRQHGFAAILRGLRTVSDFEFEYQMALTNRHLAPAVETVFVMPNAKFAFVSSSLIKDVVRLGGDVSAFLPDVVAQRLRARLAGPSQPKGRP
jgi:pantetheine-phosphate adenylyltransferase